MKTKWIRYSRILKHGVKYLLTGKIIHLMEIEHYYHTKKFRKA